MDLRNTLDGLCRSGRLTQKDVDLVTSLARTKDESALHPIVYLAQQSLVDKTTDLELDIDALTHWMSEYSKQPYYRIDPLKVNSAAVTTVMSYAFAQRHGILAVEVTPEYVVITSGQPFNTVWEKDLSHVLQRSIRRVVSNPTDIQRYTVEFYSLSKSIRGAAADNGSGAISNLEQMLELGAMKDPDANDQHIVQIVDWLLQYAFAQRASDIHIEPRREVGNIRFRIDGVLHQVYELPAQVLAAVTSRIKILGRMNVAEKRRPQDGRVKTKTPEGLEIELRLSTLPTAFGEKLVMRIFDPDVLLRTFQELGLTDDDLLRWQGMTGQPNGIVLVTGPTGSGKTTTLYSTLKKLAVPEVNVCTIEDPIEMVEGAFNQMQVQHNIDLDFATGVRTLLRQDPDIIMVGEIRDRETAEMAIQAALTGHLVLSTLHTNDAPTAITRMLELGIPAYLINATMLGVMAQRLVRTLCPKCKVPEPIDLVAWKQLTAPWKVPPPETACKPVGCLECRHTGYLGRMGIYEILPIDEQTKKLIGDTCDLKKLRMNGVKGGMRTLRLSGAQKVGAGFTTIAEVMRVAPALDT